MRRVGGCGAQGGAGARAAREAGGQVCGCGGRVWGTGWLAIAGGRSADSITTAGGGSTRPACLPEEPSSAPSVLPGPSGGELGRSYEQLCSQVTDFPSFARAPLRPHWGTDSFGIIVCESLKRDYPFWENESAIRILESARGKMLHLCILGREG